MFIEAKILENSAAFTLTLNRWGNRRQADKDKIQTDSDKSMLKLSKELIDADEYRAIAKFQGEVRKWIMNRSVPSFFKKGIYLFNISMVEEVEDFLKDKLSEQNRLVQKLVEVYPERMQDAQTRLNGQWQAKDYPTTDELRGLFDISWNWMKFGVPENLPQQVFDAEKEKAEKMWAEATEQITLCLRESFRELIAHATERLKTKPGEKPKVFRDSLIGNIQEFIATFNARNLTNDAELQGLVGKARVILSDAGNAETLRDNASLRNYTASKFSEIKNALDTIITERPGRKFSFDEVA